MIKDKTFSFQLRYPRDSEIIAWLSTMESRKASSAVREALKLAARNWLHGGEALESQVLQKQNKPVLPAETTQNHEELEALLKMDKEFD